VEGLNFKWVLYDTHDLSASAGGSHLLEMVPSAVEAELTKNLMPQQFEMVQSASSSAVYACCCTSIDMVALLKALRRTFHGGNFVHLTVAVEAIKVADAGCEPGNLAGKIEMHHLEQLHAAIRYAQMTSPNVAVPSPNDERQPCAKDHLRPKIKDGKWSESVFVRREEGKAFRRVLATGEDSQKQTIQTARTFDGLTSLKDPGDARHLKLAVISIDGNGFGNLIAKHCTDGARLKQFSEGLAKRQKGFEESLLNDWLSKRGTLAEKDYFIDKLSDDKFAKDVETPKPEDADVRLLRLQRLVTAGDDALYVMPAWLAWEFLEWFFSASWQVKLSGKHDPINLTFRVGLVICHHNAPIHRIRELAEDLSKQARDDAKKAPGGEETEIKNPIAYEVLKSFDLIGPDLAGYRRRRVEVKLLVKEKLEVVSKLRPDEMLLDGKKLKKTLEALHDLEEEMPTGKIKDPSQWPGRKKLDKPENGEAKPDNEKAINAYHLSQLREFLPESKEDVDGSLLPA